MKNNSQVLKYIYRGAYWAAFVPTLTSFLGNFVGTLIVGNKLGTASLATAGLIYPLNLLFVASGSLFGQGGVLTSSKLIGKGEHKKAKEAYTVAYVSTLLFCILSAVIFIMMLPFLLKFMMVPTQMYDNAYRYGVITLATGIFAAGTILTTGFLRLDGLNKEIVFFNMLNPVITIVVSIVMIIYMDFGIEGLAVAVAFGNGVTFFGMAYTLVAKGESVKFVRVKVIAFFKFTGQTIINGIAAASDEIAVLISMPLVNAIIIREYGEVALSAYSAYNPIQGLCLCLIVANSQALTPLLGVFTSEHDSESSNQLLKMSLRRGLLTTIPTGIIICLLAKPICILFGLGDAVSLKYAVPLIMICVLKIPLAMISNSFINVHNAFGNVVISNVLNVGKMGGFLVPTVYILSSAFGINGVWHSFWVCEVVTILVALVYGLIRSKMNPNLSKVWLVDNEYVLKGKFMSFSCNADTNDIVRCASEVDAFCHENCLIPSRSILISLAVEEMLSLIAANSLTEKDGFMNTRVVVYEDEVILRIRNGGLDFNPLDYYYLSKKEDGNYTIDDMLALDDKLGIKMVHDTARDIDYRRTFGINNLTVTL